MIPKEGMFDLSNKVALVTGGTSGIGRATARALVCAGASVVVTGARNIDAGQETVAELESLGGNAMFLRCDVTVPAAVDLMVEQAVERFGGLHIAVNNATSAIQGGGLMEANALDYWERAIQGTLSSVFYCCRAEARWMLDNGGGSIVNIASMSSSIVNDFPISTGFAAYCAGKAGVKQLTRVLAMEWVKEGVRVNSVSPGYIDTSASAGLRNIPDLFSGIIKATPMARMGRADEVAGSVVYLASDAASFTTGTDLMVDGGYTVR